MNIKKMVILIALIGIIVGSAFAQSGLASGLYIKESDIGRGRVEAFWIGSPNSRDEISVVYMRADGTEGAERKAKVSGNRLHIVAMNSSFNRVMGDGVEYFDIINRTSFRRNGVRWVLQN